MLRDEEKKRIVTILNQRIELLQCPICRKGHFALIDGYASCSINEDYHTLNLGGRMIPYVMLVCDNCGFISHHALGTLGLMTEHGK